MNKNKRKINTCIIRSWIAFEEAIQRVKGELDIPLIFDSQGQLLPKDIEIEMLHEMITNVANAEMMH